MGTLKKKKVLIFLKDFKSVLGFDETFLQL